MISRLETAGEPRLRWAVMLSIKAKGAGLAPGIAIALGGGPEYVVVGAVGGEAALTVIHGRHPLNVTSLRRASCATVKDMPPSSVSLWYTQGNSHGGGEDVERTHQNLSRVYQIQHGLATATSSAARV